MHHVTLKILKYKELIQNLQLLTACDFFTNVYGVGMWDVQYNWVRSYVRAVSLKSCDIWSQFVPQKKWYPLALIQC